MKTTLATTVVIVCAAVSASAAFAADSAPQSRPNAVPPSVQSLAAVQADLDAVKAKPMPAQKAFTLPPLGDRG